MSRRLKLVIVIGVLVILLFCCSGLAGRAPQGPFRLRLDLQAPSAAWLRSRLTEKVSSKNLQLRAGAETGCVIEGERLLVPAGASCEFAIPASANRTRQLALALPGDGSGGGSLSVRLDQELDQQNPMVVEETLQRGGDPLKLDVYSSQAKGAARLILQGCALGEGAGASCAVELRK